MRERLGDKCDLSPYCLQYSIRHKHIVRADETNVTGPGVPSLIPVRSHTFMVIGHEIISTVILLPSAESFKKGCCQLQAKVYARITG